MGSAAPKSFRSHFQRVVLASLVRTLESEAERRAGGGPVDRWRARRAEREAARLRGVLASLGETVPPAGEPVDPDATVPARVAAYTYGAAAPESPIGRPLLPPLPSVAQEAGHAEPHGVARRPVPLRPLVAVWLCSAAALPAALAWRGVGSAVSAAADVALILTTLALFAASFYARTATAREPDPRDEQPADAAPTG